MARIEAKVGTHTLGYNLRVSGAGEHGEMSRCQGMLTIQNSSEIFHFPQTLVVDFAIWPDSIQHLLSETSEDIWVVS